MCCSICYLASPFLGTENRYRSMRVCFIGGMKKTHFRMVSGASFFMLLLLFHSSLSTFTCTLEACQGVNLMKAIRRDFEPWRAKGGITRNDVEEAQSWRVHRNQHTKKVNAGWARVTIYRGQLYAGHLGAGFGSRDGVWLLMLIDLLRRHAIPDVDFVLSVMDRSHVEKSRWPWRDMLPFMLSFSTSPDHFDVGVPDSSFWSWPEKAIAPQWELMNDLDFIWPWERKKPLVHWRGGLARSGGLRKKLAACAHESPLCSKHLDIRAAGPNTDLWEPPMGMGRFKGAVFAQGEGFTSSKHRTLGTGSLPIFLEYNAHDTYYARHLQHDVHYKRIRYSLRSNATDMDDGGSCVCADLDYMTSWLLRHDAEAKEIGENARTFAQTVLSRQMVESYVLAVLREAADLEKRTKYNIEAVVREVHGCRPEKFLYSNSRHGGLPSDSPCFTGSLSTPIDVLHRFSNIDNALNRSASWERREGPLAAAVAAMTGKSCPTAGARVCAKCCPKATLRSKPERIIRSPCSLKSRSKVSPEESCKARGLADSRDPWGREAMRSIEESAKADSRRSVVGAGASSHQSQRSDAAPGKHAPAWKKWLENQQKNPH